MPPQTPIDPDTDAYANAGAAGAFGPHLDPPRVDPENVSLRPHLLTLLGIVSILGIATYLLR